MTLSNKVEKHKTTKHPDISTTQPKIVTLEDKIKFHTEDKMSNPMVAGESKIMADMLKLLLDCKLDELSSQLTKNHGVFERDFPGYGNPVNAAVIIALIALPQTKFVPFQCGTEDVIKVFINANFSLARTNIDGENILHLMTYHKISYPIAKLTMLYKYLNINEKDYYGNTPLHTSANNIQDGDTYVRYFLQNSADIKVQNNNGDNPVDMAIRKNNINLIKYYFETYTQKSFPSESIESIYFIYQPNECNNNDQQIEFMKWLICTPTKSGEIVYDNEEL